MGWIFPLARLPPIKFLPPAVHSHWRKSKNSLHDCSAAKFPSFHPSSQPECALSGLLLWCCIRQFWNNNLKTALKPAKGKTSSHYCAIVQDNMLWLCKKSGDGHRSPQIWDQGLTDCLSQGASQKPGQRKAPSPSLNWSLLWVQQDGHSLARAVVLCWFWTMGDWEGGKISCLCVCVHLSIRELKLGMRDKCWRGT